MQKIQNLLSKEFTGSNPVDGIMSKTIRWYQNPRKTKTLGKDRKERISIQPWKYINPFFFRHDRKEERIDQHRKYRHRNKIRIMKNMDILIEPKTCGWLSN